MKLSLGFLISVALPHLASANTYNPLCEEGNDEPHFNLDPTRPDCKKFYYCLDGTAELMTCPEELVFNNFEKVCDEQKLSRCAEALRGFKRREEERKTTKKPELNAKSKLKENGCVKGKMEEHFILDITVTDCSQYLHCVDGHAERMTCPAGLKFNGVRKACVEPSKSQCARSLRGFGVAVPKAIATEPPPVEVTTATPTSQPLPTEAVPEEMAQKQKKNICKGDAELFQISYVADTSNCRSFYQCFGKDPTLLYCPPGTMFNSEILACDYPEKAVCAHA